MDIKELKELVNDLYKDISYDKFLRRYYKKYRKIMLCFYDILNNYQYMEGPLPYVDDAKSIDLFGEYLKLYFSEYYEDYEKTNISIYSKNRIIEFLLASKEKIISGEFDDINLTKDEAKDILIAGGYCDFFFGDIKILSESDIGTSLTISHEYTHRMHYMNNRNNNNDNWFMYSEYLAYYNYFLFLEYLMNNYNFSSCKIQYNNCLLEFFSTIKIIKIMDDFYHKEKISDENLEILEISLENDIVPLFDYHHNMAFLAAKNKYEETKGKSFEDRTRELKEMFGYSLDAFRLRENNLHITSEKILEKVMTNFIK